MSGEYDTEKLKRLIRQGRQMQELNEAIKQARQEVEAEDAAAQAESEDDLSDPAAVVEDQEPVVRGLTYSEIKAAFQASISEDEERGHRGSKPNVAKRLDVSESTLVRAWSDLHGGDPPEWPTGLNP